MELGATAEQLSEAVDTQNAAVTKEGEWQWQRKVASIPYARITTNNQTLNLTLTLTLTLTLLVKTACSNCKHSTKYSHISYVAR